VHDQGRVVGTVTGDTAPVWIAAGILKQILAYSELDTHRELGGFLLGTYRAAPDERIEIREFLRAVDTESHAASLRFTHDTWANLTRQVDRRDAGRVIGWHHTHPQMGVFLSAHDLFVHRHFFSQPWQIAMVVDPVAHEFGFFRWRDNRVIGCGFVCLSE